jgi:hypothetical protein
MHGKMRNKYNILAAELKGKRPLKLPRHRWKGNKMDLKGAEHEDMSWRKSFMLGPSGGLL